MPNYSKKTAQAVINEISRLEHGNTEQRKRSDQFLAYIDRVMADPENTDYIKKDCGKYRAAPYKTGQYRIFFELIDELVDFNPSTDKGIKAEGKFVHFVWLNNENCKHDSDKGDHDPCYREFKNLMNKANGLEIFKRPNAPKGFMMGGVLGKTPALYPKFFDLYGMAQAFANLNVNNSSTSGVTEYKLDGLISIPDSEPREFELLNNIISEANKYGYRIVWEIMRDHRFPRHQKLAQHLKMKLVEQDSIWEVYSNL